MSAKWDGKLMRINKDGVLFSQCTLRHFRKKRNPSSPDRSRSYHLPITSAHALPLSYRRLVGAKAIKLSSCHKHPARKVIQLKTHLVSVH